MDTRLSRRAFSLAFGAFGPLSLLGRDTSPQTPTDIPEQPPNFTIGSTSGAQPSEIQDFHPSETSSSERPLLSEIVKDPRRCAEIKAQLTKVYSTIAGGIRPQDSPHLLDVWEHANACKTLIAKNNVHMTWQFMPWHRGFVYFHERMIRNVCKLPDFRIPVWDWEAVGSEKIPEPYAQWKSGLPLAPQFNRTVSQLDRPFSSEDLQGWMLTSPSNLTEFIGTSDGKSPGKAASGSPHMLVHSTLIGPMSNLLKAAGDPLFFAHHANVDRCWSKWIETYSLDIENDDRHLKPWLDSKLTFLDHVSGHLVNVSVRSLMFDNWGYKYRPLDLELYPFESVIIKSASNSSSGLVTIKNSDLTQILNVFKDQTGRNLDGSIDVSRWSDTRDKLTRSLDEGKPFSLPLQITTTDPNLADGHYAVGVQRMNEPTEEPLILGEFSILGSGHHHSKTPQSFIVTGQITRSSASDLLARVVKTGTAATLRAVYGKADASGSQLKIKAGEIRSMNLSQIEIRSRIGKSRL